MKVEQAKKIADEALETLAQALEQGHSEAMTQYLTTMARFHKYSIGNAMLIAFQRPDATLVAGFHSWLKMHRYVKKGEKGIVILAPMVFGQKQELQHADETSDAESEISSQATVRFRAVYVFDVSQTDGEPMPEFATVNGEPNGYLDGLRALVVSEGIEVSYSDELGGADGVSTGGKILLRPGLSRSEEFSTLAHELAHEKLHRGQDRAQLSKSVRELEAEAVAFVVSNGIGLDTTSASSDYIQIYNGDKTLLAASLDRIQKAAADILAAISAGD